MGGQIKVRRGPTPPRPPPPTPEPPIACYDDFCGECVWWAGGCECFNVHPLARACGEYQSSAYARSYVTKRPGPFQQPSPEIVEK
jgi:hypothetical protein